MHDDPLAEIVEELRRTMQRQKERLEAVELAVLAARRDELEAAITAQVNKGHIEPSRRFDRIFRRRAASRDVDDGNHPQQNSPVIRRVRLRHPDDVFIGVDPVRDEDL
jgi:hypothetical protein